ncbi:hypothetical protein QJS10_CPB15g01001 [Acorus calamus]|uniref:Uncharacterized protein n=1 Tax=Acorus calamus TaxID=4465 RepID=A0AAV9D6R6_ACOCL|nr:hypothetical protein QJS10_CPB15g01001 [Acorus calamus]
MHRWHKIVLFTLKKLFQDGFMTVQECISAVHKDKRQGINLQDEELLRLARFMGRQTDSLPTKHLGLPLHVGRLKTKAWSLLLFKDSKKRLEGWQCKVLSLGARITLLQAVLSNLPIFFLSLFKIPKGVLQQLESIRR